MSAIEVDDFRFAPLFLVLRMSNGFQVLYTSKLKPEVPVLIFLSKKLNVGFGEENRYSKV